MNFLIDVVAGVHLLLVEPAANTPPLQRVMNAPGKGFIGMAVADEAGVEPDGGLKDGR